MCFYIPSRRLCFVILAGTETRSIDQVLFDALFKNGSNVAWQLHQPVALASAWRMHLIRSHRSVYIHIFFRLFQSGTSSTMGDTIFSQSWSWCSGTWDRHFEQTDNSVSVLFIQVHLHRGQWHFRCPRTWSLVSIFFSRMIHSSLQTCAHLSSLCTFLSYPKIS